MGAANSTEVQERVANATGITIEELLALPRDNTNHHTKLCGNQTHYLAEDIAEDANSKQLCAGIFIILIILFTFPLIRLWHSLTTPEKIGSMKHSCAHMVGTLFFFAAYALQCSRIILFEDGYQHRFYCEASPDWSVFDRQDLLYRLTSIFGFIFPLWLVLDFLLVMLLIGIGTLIALPFVFILRCFGIAVDTNKWKKTIIHALRNWNAPGRTDDVELVVVVNVHAAFEDHQRLYLRTSPEWNERPASLEAAHINDPPPKYTPHEPRSPPGWI